MCQFAPLMVRPARFLSTGLRGVVELWSMVQNTPYSVLNPSRNSFSLSCAVYGMDYRGVSCLHGQEGFKVGEWVPKQNQFHQLLLFQWTLNQAGKINWGIQILHEFQIQFQFRHVSFPLLFLSRRRQKYGHDLKWKFNISTWCMKPYRKQSRKKCL